MCFRLWFRAAHSSVRMDDDGEQEQEHSCDPRQMEMPLSH